MEANTAKEIAEYIVTNARTDMDERSPAQNEYKLAQAYLDTLEERKELIKLSRAYLVLLDEMEDKVLVPGWCC